MGRGTRRRPRLLAAKLREIRDGLGHLSQAELVERLGLAGYINPNEISDFERGVREPDLLTLKAYADGAGLLLDDLVDDRLELPKELPAAERTRRARGKSQNKQTRATKTTTILLETQIQSADNLSRAEDRARVTIEKVHLKRYGMKKLQGGEYELTVSYEDDATLDEQIYALLGAIIIEGKKRKCSVTVNVREKGTKRYW
jgi:transcriptional regulator with XRE-family HTH domain